MLTQPRTVSTLLVLLMVCTLLGGCIPRLIGGMMQNEEYQKKIEVLPKYDDLEDKTVAVLVDVDMGVLYDHPGLDGFISDQIVRRLTTVLETTRFVHPNDVARWIYEHPQWFALPYGDLPKLLNVDRVIVVDLLEYRLHPPGNRYQWEGVAVAEVLVIESDAIDPDLPAETMTIAAEFPGLSHVTAEEATQQRIELGLMGTFIKKTCWLFYRHIEPKYPDKYRPHLDPDYDPRGAIRTEQKDGV